MCISVNGILQNTLGLIRKEHLLKERELEKCTLSVLREPHDAVHPSLSCPSGLSWHHFVEETHKLIMIPGDKKIVVIRDYRDYRGAWSTTHMTC